MIPAAVMNALNAFDAALTQSQTADAATTDAQQKLLAAQTASTTADQATLNAEAGVNQAIANWFSPPPVATPDPTQAGLDAAAQAGAAAQAATGNSLAAT